jgi:pimeloyl-ACP methyl ester carboxylesterase
VRSARGVWILVASGAVALVYLAYVVRPARDLHAVEARGRVGLKSCAPRGIEGRELCGTYEVYEDRAAKSGRTIGLNIIVLPALSESAAPDPVFWLEGGPGGAATGAVGAGRNGFLSGFRKNRDLVFVDQRGTGGSNPLDCDLADDPEDLERHFGELFPLDRVRECRARLETKANLALYTTPIAMDDLDEVREALGYAKINIAGGSYGSLAAQVYMRQHPEHVRAAILSGVATPAIRQPLLFLGAAQYALDYLYTDCAADESCRKAFPELKAEFATVLGRFENGPVAAELINPATRQKRTVRMTRESFVERLRLLLYTTGSARFVPLVIHRASQNDYQALEAVSLHMSPGLGLSRGMYLTVTCSEGVPFIAEEMIVEEAKRSFVGETRVRAHMEACKEWPRGKIPASYMDLVKSDAPVLLISGEVDGATPPWFGEAALKNFPNGRQVKIRYLGHQSENRCVAGLMWEFIERVSARDLDTSCTEQIRRPPFATELPPWMSWQ